MGVYWNHCFLCLSKLSLRNNRRTRSLGKKLEEADDGSILIKYLYGSKCQKYDNSLQRILQLLKRKKSSSAGGEGSCDDSSGEKLINFCEQCDASIKRVSELHKTLENLEIIQMKLIDTLRTVREKVLSNSKAYGQNESAKSFFQIFENLEMAPGHQTLAEDRKIVNLLYEFHDAVYEGQIARIPYVLIKPISHFESGQDSPCWDADDTEVDRTECDNVEVIAPPPAPQMVHYAAAKIEQETELEEPDINDFDDGIININEDPAEQVKFGNKDLDPKPIKQTNNVAKSKRPKRKRKRVKYSKYGSDEPDELVDNDVTDPDFDIEEEVREIGRSRKHRLDSTAEEIEGDDDDDEIPIKFSRKAASKSKKKILPGLVASGNKNPGQRRRFRCNTCPYVTMWRYNLYFHLRGHETGDKVHNCPECGQQFSGEQFFNLHCGLHKGTFKILCDFENCQERVHVPSMTDHLLKAHKIDKIFQCQYCLFCCTTQANYYLHTARHLETRVINPYKIACGICLEEFNVRKKFLTHVCEIHNVDLKLLCNECSKTFFEPRLLKCHMERHYGRGNEHETMIVRDRRNKNRYNCASCSYSTKKHFNFEHHLKEHEIENPEEFDICPHCDEEFSGQQLYDLHLQFHERRFKIACDIENCEEQVPVANMATHLSRIHQIRNTYQCKYCSFCCGTVANYYHHLANHLEPKNKFHIPCGLCSVTFEARNEFLRHVYDEHKVIEELICQECSKSFLDPQHLAQHKSHHIIKESMVCAECNASFWCKKSFRSHMRTHSKREGKSILDGCSYCGQRFITQRALERHMIAEHKAPKAKCTYCEKEFLDYMALMLHVEKDHQGCCFPCLLCEMTFETRQTWRRHMVIHMLEETYVCEDCGKEFKKKVMFQKHRLLHSAVRSYQCTYCEMAFRNGNTLRDHIRIHTGENPHVCELCGKAFRQRGTMNRHKQQVHQQQSGSLDLIIT